jgi:hypothetical protein
MALALRLSFFLWAPRPTNALMDLARAGKLRDQNVSAAGAAHARRSARRRARPRFAAQWLRLDDMEKVNPDRLCSRTIDQQLAERDAQGTELFFDNLVREDRSVLDLLSADYTFVNERLARHYGIHGVAGEPSAR